MSEVKEQLRRVALHDPFVYAMFALGRNGMDYEESLERTVLALSQARKETAERLEYVLTFANVPMLSDPWNRRKERTP